MEQIIAHIYKHSAKIPDARNFFILFLQLENHQHDFMILLQFGQCYTSLFTRVFNRNSLAAPSEGL